MIYERMLEYYDLADQLIEAIEISKNQLNEEQMAIIELMVENLEKQSDVVTSKYVEFVADDSPRFDLIKSIQEAFKGIDFAIKEGRKHLLAFSTKNN